MRFLAYVLVFSFLVHFRSAIGHADLIVFSTSTSQFNAGIDNQGFWAADGLGSLSNVGSSDTYGVGVSGSSVLRNFFSFDLSSLGPDQVITGATLEVRRYIQSGQNEAFETLEFFDVTTNAAVLNNKNGTSTSIFSDLGTGTSYGVFDVDGVRPSVAIDSFALNSSAVANLNGAKGGFFSVGGTLISNDDADALYPIGSIDLDPATLTVQFTPVPEPTSLAVASIAIVLGVIARRRRRTK